MDDIYQDKPLKVPADASLVRCSTGRAQADDAQTSKRNPACRGENTRDGARPNVGKHTVFVLSVGGKALTPTTPSRARKLLKTGAAKKVWSKFNMFGIRLLTKVRMKVPKTTLGVDGGVKYEGYAVVCGIENTLSVHLELPNKKAITAKLRDRRLRRRGRRKRKCRRRESRYQNRKRSKYTPSVLVVSNSRLKVARELFNCFPISVVGFENVRVCRKKFPYMDVSAVETTKMREIGFFMKWGARVSLFIGHETKQLRQKYSYPKLSKKSSRKFGAHCSDALALACEVGPQHRVEPGVFVVVDDTYRPIRRSLQRFGRGTRPKYTEGTILGLGKGTLIGTPRGKSGILCGRRKDRYRYYDEEGKRQVVKKLAWISRQFIMRCPGSSKAIREGNKGAIW